MHLDGYNCSSFWRGSDPQTHQWLLAACCNHAANSCQPDNTVPLLLSPASSQSLYQFPLWTLMCLTQRPASAGLTQVAASTSRQARRDTLQVRCDIGLWSWSNGVLLLNFQASQCLLWLMLLQHPVYLSYACWWCLVPLFTVAAVSTQKRKAASIIERVSLSLDT